MSQETLPQYLESFSFSLSGYVLYLIIVSWLLLQILHLASLLQISGTDDKTRHGRVLMLVAESAIQASDYKFACETCQSLILEEYVPVWTICR